MSENAGFDYERSDIESAGTAWLATGLALFVIAVPLLMPLFYPQSMTHRTPSGPPALSADAPLLDIAPKQELERLQRSEATLTDGYGWADRDKRTVHIPVTRAIELLIQRGLPEWPTR
jgi:hypothetical protein